MIIKPNNDLAYWNGVFLHWENYTVRLSNKVTVCIFVSICVVQKLKIYYWWNGLVIEAHPHRAFSALWPCCLRMNSELLLDVTQLGLESMRQSCWPWHFQTGSCKQACTEGLEEEPAACHRDVTGPPPFTPAFDSITVSSGQWFLPGALSDLMTN